MAVSSEVLGGAPAAPSSPRGVAAYRHLHRWMMLGLLITLLGFSPTYFFNLREASWLQHVHGLSATMWMALLVVQPYLASHGRLHQHRRFGALALILAGMVAASALNVVPSNIQNAVDGTHSPVAPATFLYGVSFFDLISVMGFITAVVMAIIRVRHTHDHAIWMSSTLFWVLSPGLTRMVGFGLLFTVGLGELTLVDLIFWVGFPIMAVIIGLMIKLRRAHPALVLAAIGNSVVFFIAPLGESDTWRALCNAVLLSGSGA